MRNQRERAFLTLPEFSRIVPLSSGLEKVLSEGGLGKERVTWITLDEEDDRATEVEKGDILAEQKRVNKLAQEGEEKTKGSIY